MGSMILEGETKQWTMEDELQMRREKMLEEQHGTTPFGQMERGAGIHLEMYKNLLAESLYSWSSKESKRGECDQHLLNIPLLAEELRTDGFFAYEMLICCRNEFSLRYVLENGAGFAINLQYLVENQREAVIHRVCDVVADLTPSNKLAMIQVLINCGADPNLMRNEDGLRPMDIAAGNRKNPIELCNYLRGIGAQTTVLSRL